MRKKITDEYGRLTRRGIRLAIATGVALVVITFAFGYRPGMVEAIGVVVGGIAAGIVGGITHVHHHKGRPR